MKEEVINKEEVTNKEEVINNEEVINKEDVINNEEKNNKKEVLKILDLFTEIRPAVSSSSKSEKRNKSEDKEFENDLRAILENTFSLSKVENKVISENKEFHFYEMDLFDLKQNNEPIMTKYYDEKEERFFIKQEDEYFIIRNNNLSKLYYYNSKNNEKLIFPGIEESQLTSYESTKFYLMKEKEMENPKSNPQEMEPTFLNDIKLNLMSEKTISFIGENENIPEQYLKDCYVKGHLISKGNNPFLLCFGKETEINTGEGKFHYPMGKYYVKLTSIKGQYDAAYKNFKDINLNDFDCKITYSNFTEIPKGNYILFEFKNGKGGEKKVLDQANNYQKTAEFLLKNNKFYHIIIIQKKSLSNAISAIINKNKSIISNLNNFAILCLEDKYEICKKNLKDFSIKNVNNKQNKTKNVSIFNQKGTIGEVSIKNIDLSDNPQIIKMQKDIDDIKKDLKDLFILVKSIQDSLVQQLKVNEQDNAQSNSNLK